MMSKKNILVIKIVFNIIFIILVITMLSKTFDIYVTSRNLKSEIKDSEKKVQEYTEKKEKIKNDIKNFSEEEKIERVARDKLNLKKEGEVTYKIIE